MKPIRRSMHGNRNTLPVPEDMLPPLPEGYRWDKPNSGGISSGNWRYIYKDEELSMWAVRNMEGKLCMGVINHEGYTVDLEDYPMVVTRLLTMHRLGIKQKVIV